VRVVQDYFETDSHQCRKRLSAEYVSDRTKLAERQPTMKELALAMILLAQLMRNSTK